MAVLEPPDDDELFARLSREFDIDPVLAGAVSFTMLSELELMERKTEMEAEMLQRGEVRSQHTERGRELASEYSALIYEMRKRKLM